MSKPKTVSGQFKVNTVLLLDGNKLTVEVITKCVSNSGGTLKLSHEQRRDIAAALLDSLHLGDIAGELTDVGGERMNRKSSAGRNCIAWEETACAMQEHVAQLYQASVQAAADNHAIARFPPGIDGIALQLTAHPVAPWWRRMWFWASRGFRIGGRE